MIHTSGINRMLSLLNTDLSHIAVGSGSAPTESATVLTSETYRKPITLGITDGNVLIKEVYLDETEANGTIAAIGIFGNGATSTAGSGQLFASGAAAIVKDNTQSLTISFEIEVREVAV